MDLDRYLDGLLRHWYLVVLFALIGAGGTYLYFLWNGKTTVSMAVAVWEPAVVRAGTAQQAQLSFAPIVQSNDVAERVVKRLGLNLTPDALKGEISVKLGKSLVPNLVTPLYVISVDDKDPNRATQILNATFEESRQVFGELNSVDPAQVDAAFAPSETRLQAQLDVAQEALRQFEVKSDAYGLPARIDSQVTLLNNLRQDSRSVTVGTRAGSLDEVRQSLATEQKRLTQLRALQPQYDRLAFNEKLAADAVELLVTRQQTTPPPASAKAQVVDSKASLNNALNALAAFQKSNGVGDLPSQIATQTSLVNNLLQLQQQAQLSQGLTSTTTATQLAQARYSVEQAKNAAYAANANRDGVCNPANPKYQCDAANAQANAAQTGVNQAELAVKALGDSPTPSQLLSNINHSLAATQSELDRLRGLLPEYERLSLDVSFASGEVTQSMSRNSDLSSQPSSAALESQAIAAQSKLDQTRTDLTAFQKSNGVGDLPTDLASQQALVNDLQRQVLAGKAEAVSRDGAIAAEQSELDRLTALRPDYDRLSNQVALVQSQITQLQASELTLLVGGEMLPSVEVKVLDAPRVEPAGLWSIVLYVLSVVLGLIVGLVVVYMLTYFDPTPRSVEDVETLVGAPVLVRLPRAS